MRKSSIKKREKYYLKFPLPNPYKKKKSTAQSKYCIGTNVQEPTQSSHIRKRLYALI